jgi:DNA-binding NarL/FixJ family response regulator
MRTDPDPTPNSGDHGAGVLTPLQKNITALVTEGLSNREIAARLAVTPEAVSDEIMRVFQALRLCSRVQIAVWTMEHGLHR